MRATRRGAAILALTLGLAGVPHTASAVTLNEGDIVVADSATAAVIRVDPASGVQTTVSSGGKFAFPFGIAVEADGNILVADRLGVAVVIRVDPASGAQTLVSFGAPLANPNALAVVPAIGPVLSLFGAGPGTVSLELSNATPNGSVGLGWGTSEGSVTLPSGPCAGTEIGLADPTLLMVLSADPEGNISFDQNVGAGACGLLLQALDVTTCEPSNVASVP